MYLEAIFRLVVAVLMAEERDSFVITTKCHQLILNFGK